MSDANNFSIEQHINPYYGENKINNKKAINEHAAIQKLLSDAGIKIIKVPSPINCQDGVYTANWALVRGNKAILASLPNARKAEESYAEKILVNLGKEVIHVPNGYKFSGQGDALACGNYLLCGSGYRSDKESQKFAAEALSYDLVQLHTLPQLDANNNPIINKTSGWPDSFYYDIDLALAIIKSPSDKNPGLIAYCKEAFDKLSQEKLEKLENVETILVSEAEAREAFATNLVSTGQKVIMSAYAPKLSEALRQRGLEVFSTDITELSKGGGYIRCVTLSLD